MTRPHYLLFSEAQPVRSGPERVGRWRFRLECLDGPTELEASDQEQDVPADRLALLAVVRGLEALDQPSRVTLVTSSSYVARGLRYGLAQWRDHGWHWERFGRMSPVNNGDLWQRVDQALRFHRVECRTWRFDRAHDDAARGSLQARCAGKAGRERTAGRRVGWVRSGWRRVSGWMAAACAAEGSLWASAAGAHRV